MNIINLNYIIHTKKRGAQMENEVTLREFIDFKNNYVCKFFPENLDTWSSRILLECVHNKSLMEEMKKYISMIDVNISPQQLDDVLTELRNKMEKYFDIASKQKDVEQSFKTLSIGMIYLGLFESIDELSTFSDNLIQDIKEKYGDNYLLIIQQIDRIYLSKDSKKVLKSTEKKVIEDELLKKYLVLKKWQDRQHDYYHEVIQPLQERIENEFEKQYPLNISVNVWNPIVYEKLYDLTNKSIIQIDELTKYYLAGIKDPLIKLIGGKAYGLVKLNSIGEKIPETYVIPTTLKDIKPKMFDSLDSKKNYSVRSSADTEDGKKNSYAGMFDSYLNVNYKDLLDNTKKVIDSKNNTRVQKYIQKNNLSQPNMAVVIQEFKEPQLSGVWIGKSQEDGVLEYVKGNREKLVSGKVTPSREIWIDGESTTNKIEIDSKPIGKILLDIQKRITDDSSEVADFEWMILDDELVMLQYRPVTSEIELDMIANEENLTEDGKEIFHGIPASPGFVSGPARFINAKYIDQVDDWHKGDILMAWYTDPEWMDILSNSSGIVTAVGGFLCHAAIIARELGIPCVIGIGQNMKKLWDEKEITIDADNGIVYGNSKVKKLNS